MAEVLWSDNLKKVVQELQNLQPEEIESRLNDEEYLTSNSVSKEEASALQELYIKSKSTDTPEATWN